MSQNETSQRRTVFISLRVKLLLLFILLFTVAFAAAFYWFYNFATDLALSDLRRDLEASALAASTGIDGDVHQRLYESGEIDDEDYLAINQFLRSILATSPKAAGVYTYVQEPNEPDQVRFVVSSVIPPVVEPDPREVQLLAERGCTVFERPLIGDPYQPFGNDMFNGLNRPTFAPEIVSDDYGDWLSGFAPITNSAGERVGAVGVDMCAEDVIALQDNILRTLIPAFGVGFLVTALLVYYVSYRLTRPINRLTTAADAIGRGNYDQDVSKLHSGFVIDEVATLAEVFEIMVSKVRIREEKLKQQVAELQIIVDETKRNQQVEEIVESEFFRELRTKANEMRARRTDKPGVEADEL
jgi:HAMP domain-containing protein